MSLKSSFEGISSWFKGPNNRAQLDMAHNVPVAGSKRAMQMVIAALSSLGLMTHTPRNYMQGSAKPNPIRSIFARSNAPRPGKNDGF